MITLTSNLSIYTNYKCVSFHDNQSYIHDKIIVGRFWQSASVLLSLLLFVVLLFVVLFCSSISCLKNNIIIIKKQRLMSQIPIIIWIRCCYQAIAQRWNNMHRNICDGDFPISGRVVVISLSPKLLCHTATHLNLLPALVFFHWSLLS